MFNSTKTEGSILAGTDCAEIVASNYGLTGATLKRQIGWFDVTFLVEPQNAPKHIFKVFMDMNTSTVEVIEAEIEMINYLHEKGFAVPRLIKNLQGKYWGEAEFNDEERGKTMKRFRMSSYIEGIPLRNNINPALSSQLGDLAGRVVAALADFKTSYPKEPEFLTFLSEELNIRKLHLKVPEKFLPLAVKALEIYDREVTPRLSEFPIQQIHCDMHGANLICDEGYKNIVGLIDFSDSKHTIRSLEPGICLGYIIMFSPEPLKAIDNFLTAFSKHITLTQLEKETLLIVTIMRQVQAMSVNNHCAETIPNFDPGYLDRIYGPAWTMIERLLDPNSEEARFFQAFSSK